MREWAICVVGLAIVLSAGGARGDELNLAKNPDFKLRSDDGRAPASYDLAGAVEYRYLGDPNRDSAQWGVALQSIGRAGSVSQTVHGIDASR